MDRAPSGALQKDARLKARGPCPQNANARPGRLPAGRFYAAPRTKGAEEMAPYSAAGVKVFATDSIGLKASLVMEEYSSPSFVASAMKSS
jgi:hypothetical protein